MTRRAVALAALLSYSVLTIWIEPRWAWALAQFAVFVFLGIWAVAQWRSASGVRGSLWLVPLGAVPAWGLLQLAGGQTVYRYATWNAVLNWITWLAVFFLALQVFEMPAARRWFLRFALYFGAILCVISTVQMFTPDGKIFWLFASGYHSGVMGPFVNRNQYAAFLELLLPIALWQAMREPRQAFAHCAIAAAMLASVVAAASRAGTVLMCVEVAGVLLLGWRRGMVPAGRAARTLAAFTAMVLLFASIAGWQTLRHRFGDPDRSDRRMEIWSSSLAMLHAHPAAGFGLGNWPRAYPGYATFDDGTYVNQAHSDWLQWAVEGGVPLFLMLLCLAAMALPTALGSVWGIGLLSVWLHCLVDYPLQQRPAFGLWFFLLLGLLAASRGAKADRRRAQLPSRKSRIMAFSQSGRF